MKITTLAPDASGLVEWPTLSANRKSVVTVGVFDGMHRGHQAVIRRAVELAKADKAFSELQSALSEAKPAQQIPQGDVSDPMTGRNRATASATPWR